MYPNDIIAGIDLYTIALAVAIMSALIIFRIFADKLNICATLQNLCIIGAAVAIIFGYFSAVLFQAFYNIEKNGGFQINSSTGATFYGGLIGGAFSFLCVYFIAGAIIFKTDKTHIKYFFEIADIAAVSICAAHGFGRIGCLMAGCCHGAVTDKWYGIYMPALKQKVVPIQLFEAIFLFLLAGALAWIIIKKKRGNLGFYMVVYGLWRFFIEYLRDDYRGTTVVRFLTPSQLTSVLLIVGGIVYLICELKIFDKIRAQEK